MIIAVLGLFLIKSPITHSTSNPINNSSTNAHGSTKDPALTLEQELLERKQREYQEQLIAINDLMNYSADVAYGIKPKDE